MVWLAAALLAPHGIVDVSRASQEQRLDKKITVEAKDVLLRQVLKDIGLKTKLDFEIPSTCRNWKVTAFFKSTSTGEILDRIGTAFSLKGELKGAKYIFGPKGELASA